MRSNSPDEKRVGFSGGGGVGKEVVPTRSVKLQNKAALKAQEEKKERELYKEKFEKKADDTIQYHKEQNNRAVTCIQRFLKMTEDKTLQENKGSIAEDVEREIRQELIQLALDMNNDENEEDNGKGSVIVISVLTKIILLYRDRLNRLEFEFQQFKNETNKKN